MQYFYTVKSGDTLAQIADRHDVLLDNLIAANQLKNPDTLAVGEQLSIPAGIHEYAVKTGDSLYQLAENYGIDTSAIAEENNLHPPYLLKAGQKLKIPPGVPYYTVQKGDTLETIARRFNVQVKGISQVSLIQKMNKLPNAEIKEGTRLKIPYPSIGENGFIAYNSAHIVGPDIWLYNVKNGENRQLTDGIGASFSKPVWSNDSSKIAFVGRDQILYIIYHETGLIGAIDQLDEGGDFTLNWAPDNETLAYAARGIIMLYNTTSHESQEVNQPGASNVNWFPSGKELLFQALDSAGISQLYRSSLTGTDKVKVTNNTDGPIHDAQISKDGKFALYTTPGASISLIRVVDIKTGKVFEIEGGPEAKNYFPEWASNSKEIAYSSTILKKQNYRSQIRTVMFDGENDQVQAMANCYSTPVTWSPKNERIAYLSGCGEEFSTELWAVDTDEKLPIKLLEDKHIYHLQWSPTSISDFNQ